MESPAKPRLLGQVSRAARLRHLSIRTEEAYRNWIRRYVRFHGTRHPRELGPEEVRAFLSSLATEGKVAASTQNQALAALLFLYRYVLEQPLPQISDVVRARRPKHLPVVWTREEARAGALAEEESEEEEVLMPTPDRSQTNSTPPPEPSPREATSETSASSSTSKSDPNSMRLSPEEKKRVLDGVAKILKRDGLNPHRIRIG